MYRLFYGMLREITLAFLALSVAALPAPAQNSYREFERGLNLSESQRNQMEGIKRRYMNEWQGLKNESVRKRIELNELQRSRRTPLQGRRIEREDRLERDLQDIEQSREQLYRRYREEVSRVFNEEQRGRYNEYIMRERRDIMRPYRHRGHDR